MADEEFALLIADSKTVTEQFATVLANCFVRSVNVIFAAQSGNSEEFIRNACFLQRGRKQLKKLQSKELWDRWPKSKTPVAFGQYFRTARSAAAVAYRFVEGQFAEIEFARLTAFPNDCIDERATGDLAAWSTAFTAQAKSQRRDLFDWKPWALHQDRDILCAKIETEWEECEAAMSHPTEQLTGSNLSDAIDAAYLAAGELAVTMMQVSLFQHRQITMLLATPETDDEQQDQELRAGHVANFRLDLGKAQDDLVSLLQTLEQQHRDFIPKFMPLSDLLDYSRKDLAELPKVQLANTESIDIRGPMNDLAFHLEGWGKQMKHCLRFGDACDARSAENVRCIKLAKSCPYNEDAHTALQQRIADEKSRVMQNCLPFLQYKGKPQSSETNRTTETVKIHIDDTVRKFRNICDRLNEFCRRLKHPERFDFQSFQAMAAILQSLQEELRLDATCKVLIVNPPRTVRVQLTDAYASIRKLRYIEFDDRGIVDNEELSFELNEVFQAAFLWYQAKLESAETFRNERIRSKPPGKSQPPLNTTATQSVGDASLHEEARRLFTSEISKLSNPEWERIDRQMIGRAKNDGCAPRGEPIFFESLGGVLFQQKRTYVFIEKPRSKTDLRPTFRALCASQSEKIGKKVASVLQQKVTPVPKK
ncbi:hypothetical protein [Rhodopirellula sp. P2]|uniref:hypothetical protein n=1 Tax=Rhodopirellula sp. P2 TaxID=2127060 RepID=UPI002367C37F|nr:hypothetical protein [Rhodopirellula sp. P2]WDQ16795.1 hypothetical protein PSR62_24730 [Rhodopirellula sp. P2]